MYVAASKMEIKTLFHEYTCKYSWLDFVAHQTVLIDWWAYMKTRRSAQNWPMGGLQLDFTPDILRDVRELFGESELMGYLRAELGFSSHVHIPQSSASFLVNLYITSRTFGNLSEFHPTTPRPWACSNSSRLTTRETE